MFSSSASNTTGIIPAYVIEMEWHNCKAWNRILYFYDQIRVLWRKAKIGEEVKTKSCGCNLGVYVATPQSLICT